MRSKIKSSFLKLKGTKKPQKVAVEMSLSTVGLRSSLTDERCLMQIEYSANLFQTSAEVSASLGNVLPSLMHTGMASIPSNQVCTKVGYMLTLREDDLQKETREAGCSCMCKNLAEKMTRYIRGDGASLGTRKTQLCC